MAAALRLLPTAQPRAARADRVIAAPPFESYAAGISSQRAVTDVTPIPARLMLPSTCCCLRLVARSAASTARVALAGRQTWRAPRPSAQPHSPAELVPDSYSSQRTVTAVTYPPREACYGVLTIGCPPQHTQIRQPSGCAPRCSCSVARIQLMYRDPIQMKASSRTWTVVSRHFAREYVLRVPHLP